MMKKQIWVDLEDLKDFRRLKRLKDNGKIESDPETFKKLMRKLKGKEKKMLDNMVKFDRRML